MAMRVLLFLVSSLLLVSTWVSSSNAQLVEEKTAVTTPVQSPLKTPPPAPIYAKVPPPPSPVKVPPPPAPVKAPVPPPAPPVAPPTPTLPRPRTTKECIPPCLVRCKLHSRKNICLRACVTCCDRCKCVPPGQYGNKEMCGKCYANMTTRGGRPKCP